MTATAGRARAARLRRADVPEIVELLERDFGEYDPDLQASAWPWAFPNHFLLDALDRGEHSRFVIWPEGDPVAVLYQGPTGTLVPAGDPEAALAFSEAGEHAGWRILIGDLPIAQGILDHSNRALFRRRVSARQQRFMVATAESVAPGEPPAGFRAAAQADIERLTDFACELHVEDQMGPPISRAGRGAVRSRMVESVSHGATWVVERAGEPVAKVDLSVRSRRRGAQIAGVFVDPAWRSQGIGGDCVAALTRLLIDDGLPFVSLHVRADNVPAMSAYRRAGFSDERAWLLALR